MFKKSVPQHQALIVNPDGESPKVFLHDVVVWPWQSCDYVDLEPKKVTIAGQARSQDGLDLSLTFQVCLAVISNETGILEAARTVGAKGTFSRPHVSAHFTPHFSKALERTAAEFPSEEIQQQSDALRDRLVSHSLSLADQGYHLEELEVLEVKICSPGLGES